MCRGGGECRWGWCRQVASFVFLFPRHNCVVVERPEYGRATYFFELEAHRPTTWQLQRILAVMRVPSARSSMVDNRGLQAGEEDLAVLKSFGWAPGMGLGKPVHLQLGWDGPPTLPPCPPL